MPQLDSLPDDAHWMRLALAEARAAAQAGANSMMDVSDGLGQDLGRLARASGVSVEVHAPRVPRGLLAVAGIAVVVLVAGLHYPTDVLASIAWGLLAGPLMWEAGGAVAGRLPAQAGVPRR